MTQSDHRPASGSAKLPIWRTVGASYRFLATHPGELARVGWLPLVALFGLNVLFGAFDPLPDASGGEAAFSGLGPVMLRMLANILIQSAVAAMTLVVWHRLVVLGARVNGAAPMRMGWREARYLLSWMLISMSFLAIFLFMIVGIILLAFLAMVAAQVLATAHGGNGAIGLGEQEQFVLIGKLAMPVAALAAIWCTTRLSLVLPALATGKETGFARAWTVSRGNGARMVAASLIVMTPIQLLAMWLAEAARDASGEPAFWPLAFAASAGFLLFILATGTVLSLFSLGLDRPAAGAASRAEATA